VTENGLVIGSIATETRHSVFAWSSTTGLSSIGSLSNEMWPENINQHGGEWKRARRRQQHDGRRLGACLRVDACR
jgi:hypothetical protein